MTMAQTRAHLQSLVTDDDVRVLALSGKWGTGKSYMWGAMRDASQIAAVKTALYVSLFGVASVPELKMKLLQSVTPMLGEGGPAADALKGALATARSFAQGFFRAGSALDELALLAVPAAVRDKFIVVDDIERKQDKLSVDEVLGFIDDFTQNYGCRVLLILNTDQLKDLTIWEKLREKVIDVEVRLTTTPEEAFEIAIGQQPSIFAEHIKQAVTACGLTNIRIIRKIIRAADRILEQHSPLSDAVLRRVIPSTVLLAAIHYKGIDDGPTTDFVLKLQASHFDLTALNDMKRSGEPPPAEEKLHARWTLLLDQLGIVGTDEYEKLVHEYLVSGMFERSAVDIVVERYKTEEQFARAQARVRRFLDLKWHPDMSDDQVVAEAETMIDDVAHVDPYTMTFLHNYLVEMDGGLPVAKRMESAWIKRLQEAAKAPGARPEQFVLDNFFARPLLSSIVVAMKEARSLVEQPRTLRDVCDHLANSSGWSQSDEAIMKGASVEDFVQTIYGLSGHELKIFLLKSIDLYRNRATYEASFGSSGAHFIKACERIRSERLGTRWARLVEDVLAECGVSG